MVSRSKYGPCRSQLVGETSGLHSHEFRLANKLAPTELHFKPMSYIFSDESRPTLVVGLGCQRGCSAAALLQLIEQSLQDVGVSLQAISALASIDLKRQAPGLLELATELDLPLSFFSAQQLAAHESQLSHRSHIAFEHTGCYGIAESAALALASQSGVAELKITRQKSSQATFALAIARSVS